MAPAWISSFIPGKSLSFLRSKYRGRLFRTCVHAHRVSCRICFDGGVSLTWHQLPGWREPPPLKGASLCLSLLCLSCWTALGRALSAACLLSASISSLWWWTASQSGSLLSASGKVAFLCLRRSRVLKKTEWNIGRYGRTWEHVWAANPRRPGPQQPEWLTSSKRATDSPNPGHSPGNCEIISATFWYKSSPAWK